MSDSSAAPALSPDARASIEAAFALGVPRDYGRMRRLVRVREPRRLVCIGRDVQGRHQWLVPRAAAAWQRLRDAGAGDGVELQIVSAFRSVDYQLGILRRKVDRGLDMDEILRVSAAPGYSEHHSGRALDITTPGFAPVEAEFERSDAFAWLQRHAAEFGFVLSYPRDNVHGIAYEPWHWCFTPRLRDAK